MPTNKKPNKKNTPKKKPATGKPAGSVKKAVAKKAKPAKATPRKATAKGAPAAAPKMRGLAAAPAAAGAQLTPQQKLDIVGECIRGCFDNSNFGPYTVLSNIGNCQPPLTQCVALCIFKKVKEINGQEPKLLPVTCADWQKRIANWNWF